MRSNWDPNNEQKTCDLWVGSLSCIDTKCIPPPNAIALCPATGGYRKVEQNCRDSHTLCDLSKISIVIHLVDMLVTISMVSYTYVKNTDMIKF